MSKLDNLSIDSYIRIYNWEENENGFGWQIIRNNLYEICDMQDNFNWSDKELFECIKSDKFDVDSKYLICGVDVSYRIIEDDRWEKIISENVIEGITESEIKELVLNNILDNSLDGELREIVIEEMCDNCDIGIYTCDNNWEEDRLEKCLGEK